MNKYPSQGVALIATERAKQLSTRSVESDIELNDQHQLSYAAQVLLNVDYENYFTVKGSIGKEYADKYCPPNWDRDKWFALLQKPFKERLIIVGALIAAELDRYIQSGDTSNPYRKTEV